MTNLATLALLLLALAFAFALGFVAGVYSAAAEATEDAREG